MSLCNLCTRMCGVDRRFHRGACGCTDEVYVAKIMLHKWEEPCISGTDAVVSATDGKGGSGAVFFCGCPLGCSFCQNREISRHPFTEKARAFSASRLADAFLALSDDGAYNINLISPTQYTLQIMTAVKSARERGLALPVVWNTGGYERVETVKLLDGTVDIFLTDMKYKSSELASSLSRAPDYFRHALPALAEMVRVAGEPVYEGGMMKKGVIMRHLVLPGQRKDSIDILRAVAEAGLSRKVVLSLMSQYTPEFYSPQGDERLDRAMSRRVTTFEYEKVVEEALKLGFDGYVQERGSAVKDYTPVWGI